MTELRALDNQGLAGAFHLGVKRAGFTMMPTKLEQAAGFGNDLMQANPGLFGHVTTYLNGPAEWEPFDDVALLFGNPPCSGFSGMNTSGAAAAKRGKEASTQVRGVDSSINGCMWDFHRYAATLNGGDGPFMTAMESVPAAGRLGRPLMQALRATLEERTGWQYGLYHVFMSGATAGAAQIRRRYFLVLARDNLTFGVEVSKRVKEATYAEAIGDLQDLPMQWEPQAAVADPSPWVKQWRMNDTGGMISDHANNDDCRRGRRYLELLPWWKPGETGLDALLRCYDETGTCPPLWADYLASLGGDPRKKENWGFYQPRRIRAAANGYVLMGGAHGDFIHWAVDRFLTVRELARVQGYPDSWKFYPVTTSSGVAASWIGKGLPVQSGTWLAWWARNSLLGNPGEIQGEHIGDREFLIDVTGAYRNRV